MENEKRMVVSCLYAASDLGHFPRKARSSILRLGVIRRQEFNNAALPGSKKNGEQYDKTVLLKNSLLPEKSGYCCTEQAREISPVNDISLPRKGKSKMTDDEKHVNKIKEMEPQTPSPSKWKKSKVESGCCNTWKRRLELDDTLLPCKRRLMSNETINMVNKVQNAYQYTRSVQKFVMNLLKCGEEVSNQPRTDTDQHSHPVGQLMKKKEKKISTLGLNVETEATKEWYKLLRVGPDPEGEVAGVWPEVMFIVKVGKVQGQRVYRPWKGSVLDSVVGALLTQRVGDESSSSAFISLSMNFPQDPACDVYTRHHRILRKKRSNACSDFGKQTRIPLKEMKGRKSKKGKILEEEDKSVWEKLREDGSSARDADKVDSVDWQAVMRSDIADIAKAIVARGMEHKLAIRIKGFLNRLVSGHGNLDLEWLRNVPPQEAKDFLLGIYGIGLKSTECVRLLTLGQPAFPVDVNVARVTVRLGWVPAPSIRDDVQMNLVEQNSKLRDRIQEYLRLRLSPFNKDTLYQLHCQMITFGKVFCTKLKPNCAECPMRSECKHYSNLQEIEDMGNSRITVTRAKGAASRMKCKVKEADTLPDDSVQAPKTPVKVPLLRCQSGRDKKNTSAKAGQSGRSKTRTEHFIYVLPDLHPVLETFDDRDPDDPLQYLLVTRETDDTKAGETLANNKCTSSTSCVRDPRSVLGTIMIPCRTALKGNFPLNATHFQPNEVFADWESSQTPFDIPLRTLDGAPRKQLYCGSSLTSIVKGRSAKDISRIFNEGYICTRSLDRETHAVKALDDQLHKSTNTKKRSSK